MMAAADATVPHATSATQGIGPVVNKGSLVTVADVGQQRDDGKTSGTAGNGAGDQPVARCGRHVSATAVQVLHDLLHQYGPGTQAVALRKAVAGRALTCGEDGII